MKILIAIVFGVLTANLKTAPIYTNLDVGDKLVYYYTEGSSSGSGSFLTKYTLSMTLNHIQTINDTAIYSFSTQIKNDSCFFNFNGWPCSYDTTFASVVKIHDNVLHYTSVSNHDDTLVIDISTIFQRDSSYADSNFYLFHYYYQMNSTLTNTSTCSTIKVESNIPKECFTYNFDFGQSSVTFLLVST